MTSAVKIALGLLLAFVGVGYAVEVPELMRAYGAKDGRVVDQDTGKGVAGAWVVARAAMSSGGVFQTNHGCVYAAAAQTDKDGNYRLPSAWSHAAPGAPWFSPQTTWNVVATKPGYITTGDTPNPYTGSNGHGPSSSLGLTSTHVAEITLHKANLSTKQKVDYYAQTVRLGCEKANPTDFQALVRLVFNDLKTSVCSGSTDETLDASTVRGLAAFASSLTSDSRLGDDFARRMTERDPDYAALSKSENVTHAFKASDVCQVMTETEIKP